MANINRDYLIVLDAKSSVISDADDLKYYITDEHSQNLFINLVVRDTQRINKYVEVHDPEKYQLELHIVKPNNDIVRPHLQANLLSVSDAIYAFELPKEAVDYIGTYKCELRVTYKETDETTITTSNKFKYKVKRSIYNDLDSIQEAPQYPVVIQLFDKLSDINQYEEDRRANELVRQVAEQQRQTRFDALDTAMVDNIQEMDDKVIEVENRISAKEQAVDKLIVDTKVDIDDYKVAKDTEINEYKTAKDQQINQAITNQNNKIDDAIANQNNKIDTAVAEQNNRIEIVEASDNTQNTRLDALEAKDIAHETSITNIEAKNVEQDNRLDSIEAVNVSQDNRLDAIEAKNQQQDDRLLDVEKVNSRQDIDIKCLYGASQTIDVTKEGNSIYLQNSNNGFVAIDEIKGNTLVNCNKEPDKELILNGNINTQGYSNVTLTEGVDGGLVDVALEGNTMVNVCDQKDPIAITKSYTVETGNHVALQGEYDGKCRPVVTGNTLVNLINNGLVTYVNHNSNYYVYRCNFTSNSFKSSTTYTIIFNSEIEAVHLHPLTGLYGYKPISNNRYVFTTKAESISNNIEINFRNPTEVIAEDVKIIILEGDYTNKEIPGYFEGLQSSFEDKVVTQEMVDAGEELAENLGKYKVDYVVTGKNKFDKNKATVVRGPYRIIQLYNKDTDVAVSLYDNDASVDITGCSLGCITGNGTFREWFIDNDSIFNKTRRISNFGGILYYPKIQETVNKLNARFNIQIEEGSTATPYEPYKEYKKTFYLNSPLLEGDTIEQQGDNVVHVHRSELRAYETDDELTLPTDKTNTLVAKATPQYEVISQNDTILCDSYINGHLDVDSAVPIKKVDFIPFEEELTYLYPSIQYAVQFVSDAVSKVNITLGGAELLNQDVVLGINKYMITTPSTLVDNKLVVNGIGFNASNIVVTEATDQDFGYFEGMKSVGECEDLEVVSSNSDGTLSNMQTLTHEPLRAVGDVKDKYVLIDGKWYIERNVGKYTYTGNEGWSLVDDDRTNETVCTYFASDIPPNAKPDGNLTTFKSDKLPNKLYNSSDLGIWIDMHTFITLPRNEVNTVAELKLWLQSNPIIGLYQLRTPQYEPIDYNPFTVYSNTTHISNNSTIPCNMTIKNTGYNCMLKPSTTYTVSSNLGLNTVTTPSTLTEDCLRFYDTDTSTVTTMKDVLVLEGDWTTKADLIPANFSGIESAFEQELVTDENDEHYGKYKVTARVVGKNLFDKNIELLNGYYLSDEDGTNTRLDGYCVSKDYIRIQPNTTYYGANMNHIALYDKDKNYIRRHALWNSEKTFTTSSNAYYLRYQFSVNDDLSVVQLEQGDTATEYEPYKENNITFYINEPLRGIGNIKDKVYIKDDKVVVERNCEQREYQDGDFGTYLTDKVNTVYELAEPTYEEVEYNDVKLFIESFKNSTLFYNSNVPVTSTVHYSYSVPIVDTVAQTANVTDQQDSMIIDLATQCAIMEMYLM